MQKETFIQGLQRKFLRADFRADETVAWVQSNRMTRKFLKGDEYLQSSNPMKLLYIVVNVIELVAEVVVIYMFIFRLAPEAFSHRVTYGFGGSGLLGQLLTVAAFVFMLCLLPFTAASLRWMLKHKNTN
ncbi:MAG TPA: hypothetical protein VFH39_03645 [Candidatus Saccharimonadales bacterium]|nr:hypothetical protein [Candidatus Saccharimonadales bacterium]